MTWRRGLEVSPMSPLGGFLHFIDFYKESLCLKNVTKKKIVCGNPLKLFRQWLCTSLSTANVDNSRRGKNNLPVSPGLSTGWWRWRARFARLDAHFEQGRILSSCAAMLRASALPGSRRKSTDSSSRPLLPRRCGEHRSRFRRQSLDNTCLAEYACAG